MPVPKSKQGKPLGGVGAERQSPRRHSLILDDRLLSKQYITGQVDGKVDDTSFTSDWSTETTTAPSKAAVYNKFNSLSVSTSAWTQYDLNSTSSNSKTYRSGKIGIGAGVDMSWAEVTHKLTLDGDLRIGAIDGSDKDIYLDNGAILYKYGSSGSTAMLTMDTSGHKLAQSLAIGTSSPSVPLEVSLSGSSVTAADGRGILQLGADGAANMGIDANHIQSRDSGSGALLYINSAGGNVQIGDSTSHTVTTKGNLAVEGNLTVTGTATALTTEAVTLADNIIVLNSNAADVPIENAGIEIERGLSPNVGLRFKEDGDVWQVNSVNVATDGAWVDLATGATAHSALSLVDNSQTLLSLSGQAITVNDVVVKTAGDSMTGNLAITVAGSAASCLTINGGNSAATNAAVSITGHLEATTKSFNIPHPLYDNKRLVYGSLEGPEHGMYQRGSFDIEDRRRIVAIDLPVYWSAMTYEDYTVNLTTYGDYNVWISNRDENGFWVETNAEKEWSFDWNVIAGRKDAKLVVEPDA